MTDDEIKAEALRIATAYAMDVGAAVRLFDDLRRFADAIQRRKERRNISPEERVRRSEWAKSINARRRAAP